MSKFDAAAGKHRSVTYERADYEAKVREKRQGRAKGKHPKAPDETPCPDGQSNPSDPAIQTTLQAINR